MRILFVAIVNSIHTARWLGQIADEGWDVHVFPPFDIAPHPSLRNVTVHTAIGTDPGSVHASVKLVPPPPELAGRDAESRLTDLVSRLAPDVLHSLELQHCGYLALAARERLRPVFPTWMVSTWGSDLFLYGRLARHVERIRAVLSGCDFLLCDCARDVRLAGQLGLWGEPLPVFPAAGGYELRRLAGLRSPLPPSRRRVIALKGYQHWAGRALVGLRALEMCRDLLAGYNVLITRASADVRLAAELFAASTGVPIELADFPSHDDLLRALGTCRVHLGLSISDGTPSALLEAMITGAFPIQSNTACTDEWIEDGRTGLVVPPEDPAAVAAAVRRALQDDALVDSAAALNDVVCAERLDSRDLAPRVVAMYRDVYRRTRGRAVRPGPELTASADAPPRTAAGPAVPGPNGPAPAGRGFWSALRRACSLGWLRPGVRG